ncbi:MAG: GNAT family N-acetyltransferase [Ignavibacteria bacterium]
MIRKLKPADRNYLEKMLMKVIQFDASEVSVAMELIDMALYRPEQEDYIIYVYEENGTVSGYYCTGRRALTDGVFDLYWIVVSPDAQGKGLGSLLIKHAEDIVIENKGRWLLAETSSKESYTATRNFYIKSAYTIVAKIDNFYKVNDGLIIFGKYFQQK